MARLLRQGSALLVRATARLVGADSIGVLTVGAVADFVVLNASPLDDITNSRDIEIVALRGALYSPSIVMERN